MLMYPLKHVGIALSTSLSAIFNAVLLIYFLKGKIGGLNFKDVYRSIVKISASSLVMGGACYCFLLWGLPYFHGTKWQALALGFCIATGILIYFFWAFAFKCQELSFLIELVKKRIGKK
jgi:putative peptidoglycan lipid II flippase